MVVAAKQCCKENEVKAIFVLRTLKSSARKLTAHSVGKGEGEARPWYEERMNGREDASAGLESWWGPLQRSLFQREFLCTGGGENLPACVCTR